MKAALSSTVLTLAFFAFSCGAQGADPDPSPWSFLAGSWSMKTPEGTTTEISIELNKAKNSYVASSDTFQGTFGIDQSKDHKLLALGYHPGAGYSVGHFKRLSDTTVGGTFVFFDSAGEKSEHTGKWEKTDYGYSYVVDGKDHYEWRRR